ncbi:MAG: hypothetical protein ACRBCS_03815 [Cellvibrionaceae bacterium]
MKTNIFKPLFLLVSCLIFSTQSLSHWGPWATPFTKSSQCTHQHTGEKPTITELELVEIWAHNRRMRDVFMRVIGGGESEKVIPHIIMSNDRIKKSRPHFPIILYYDGAHTINKNRQHLGRHVIESGEIFSCRINDDV